MSRGTTASRDTDVAPRLAGAAMHRREVLALIGAGLASCPPARGATAAKVRRIGSLCAEESVPYFWEQLRRLGYEEHRNVEYLLKDVDVADDLAGHASRLVAANVDVIVACGNAEAKAALRATSRIPIVLLYGVVPVEAGLAASLARPGGNLTGSAAISLDLAAKSVEVFRSAVPKLRRLAAIVDREQDIGRILHAAVERAARDLRLELTTWPVHDGARLPGTLAELARARPDGIVVSVSAIDHIPDIIEFCARARVPAMYPVVPAVRQGALMAYAPNWIPQSRRNAEIVDRVLRGAKPRDIPIEQPLGYSFSVNLRAARALPLEIPPAVMLRATSVIR